MTKQFAIFILLLAGIFLFTQPDAVHACTPTTSPPAGVPTATPLPPITLADRINNADVVLLGTVAGDSNQTIFTAEVQVEQYFKGDGASTVQIHGFGGSSLCRAWVAAGERTIFLTMENADGSLRASYYLTYTSPLIAPTDEHIEQIIAITNQSNAPDSSGIEEDLPDAVQDNIIILVLSGIILTTLFLLLAYYRQVFR